MKNKKYISIVLISLIVFNSFGYVFAYFQMQNVFKQIAFENINKFLPQEQLTVIELSQNDLNGDNEYIETDDNEICYYGQMYDICKKETVDDKVILYCYNDENETALNSAFSSYVDQNSNTKSNTPISNYLKHLIKILYFSNYADKTFQITQDKTVTIDEYQFISIYPDVNTPPPKLS